MLLRVLQTEWAKQRRSLLPWLVIGGPLIFAGMMWVDLYLRYSYLSGRHPELTPWELLMQEGFMLWGLFYPIGITIIAALVHYREYHDHGWKHLLALPVTRSSVYTAKWLLIWLLSCVTVILLLVCLYATGRILQFPEHFPLGQYVLYGINLCIAALGVTSLQHWLSSRLSNSLYAIAIGLSGSIGALFLAQSEITRFVPYASALFAMTVHNEDQWLTIVTGLIAGPVLLLVGMAEFRQRDIS
ncbi:ABC transporter permease [Paenibacillus wulumuqiensis]|uniref:ABC transporter permease n=1 Tax=Paenibacillus wulumuqiensis TaxID=1567107 RepID=UPI0006192414|nr:ABC transporter permease [Paenibacillus wulumuqiensis]